jgi:hypothetical protein
MKKLLHHPNIIEKGVHTLLTVFGLLCIAYLIVLLSIVFSVIERKQNILATSSIGTDLMRVENSYASTLSTLDDKALSDRGFTRFESTHFAVRKDPIATYALLYAR